MVGGPIGRGAGKGRGTGRTRKAWFIGLTSVCLTCKLVSGMVRGSGAVDVRGRDATPRADTSARADPIGVPGAVSLITNVGWALQTFTRIARNLVPGRKGQQMYWIAVGTEILVAMWMARLLLRQVRGLLVDVGGVVRAWRDVVRVVMGSGSAGTRCPIGPGANGCCVGSLHSGRCPARASAESDQIHRCGVEEAGGGAGLVRRVVLWGWVGLAPPNRAATTAVRQ